MAAGRCADTPTGTQGRGSALRQSSRFRSRRAAEPSFPGKGSERPTREIPPTCTTAFGIRGRVAYSTNICPPIDHRSLSGGSPGDLRMKSCLALLFAAFPVVSLAAPPQTDIKQPQSPPMPRPDWVKIIDHGKYDPRLKGYMAPEGLKIEIVAEEPTTINPVGMTFGLDGTLYVLEWLPSTGDEWRETPVTFTY